MNQSLIIDIAVVVAGVGKVLDWFGWLPKRKTASDAAAELAIGEQTIHRLIAERDTAVARVNILEQTRSIEPVLQIAEPMLQIVEKVFETQQQTLEKLAHFNGALRRNEEGLLAAKDGLNQATEGLKFVAGMLVGASDLPTKEKPGEQTRPRRRRPQSNT